MRTLAGRAGLLALVPAVLAGARPAPASGQISSPCEIACGLVLGATGFTVATAALVARGRAGGGVSSMSEAAGAWFGAFVVYTGAGVALGGNGERQERAVYAGGIGALGGSLAGLAVEAAVGPSTEASRVAAALWGAGLGAIAGGLYGALSWSDDGAGAQPMQLGITISF